MDVRRAQPSESAALAAFAAPLQATPATHVAYLGDTAAKIVDDLEALVDWPAVSAVAVEGDVLVGWLVGEVDHELGRVWWFGPFASGDWMSIGSALHDFAGGLLPSSIEEEFAVDAEHRELVEWATQRGFRRAMGSYLLHVDGPLGAAVDPRALRTATPADTTIAALHESLFAGAHHSGAKVVAGDADERVCLVVEVGGSPVGYVVLEIEPDGSAAIEFLGVEPAHRRNGYARTLVVAGVAWLRAAGAARVHLTVRQTNDAARALYRSMGFVEERLVVPLRKGFSIVGDDASD